MNNKGQAGALIVFAILVFAVIAGGLIIALSSGITTYTTRTLNDVTSELGMIGDFNASQASDFSIGAVNETVQMFKWGSGILIVFALLGLIIFAGIIRAAPDGFLIGFYILLMLIFVISSMYVSNVYEEFLDGDDEIALELKDMQFTSWLIIYMPQIITLIGFIGGLIIFSGTGEGV